MFTQLETEDLRQTGVAVKTVVVDLDAGVVVVTIGTLLISAAVKSGFYGALSYKCGSQASRSCRCQFRSLDD
jgi:hypothetical protein